MCNPWILALKQLWRVVGAKGNTCHSNLLIVRRFFGDESWLLDYSVAVNGFPCFFFVDMQNLSNHFIKCSCRFIAYYRRVSKPSRCSPPTIAESSPFPAPSAFYLASIDAFPNGHLVPRFTVPEQSAPFLLSSKNSLHSLPTSQLQICPCVLPNSTDWSWHDVLYTWKCSELVS